MKMGREKKLEEVRRTPRNVFDLWKHVGTAVSEKVRQKGKASTDSMLAVYQNRLTYTFIMGREVASIHFDRLRGEIFFKGHNIRNLELTPEQKQALNDLKAVLANEEKGYSFLSDYCATLGRLVTDNNR